MPRVKTQMARHAQCRHGDNRRVIVLADVGTGERAVVAVKWLAGTPALFAALLARPAARVANDIGDVSPVGRIEVVHSSAT